MKNIFTLLCLLAAIQVQAQNYWQKVASGTQKHLYSVSFGSQQVGYISGSDSLLLKTTDGGNTWTQLTHSGMSLSLATPDIVHVNFVSADTGFAIASNYKHIAFNGMAYMTVNGGANWVPLSTGDNNIAPRSSFFKDVRNGLVVGSGLFSGGSMLQQQVNGVWGNTEYFSGSPAYSLYGADCYGNICIAGGSLGFAYRSTNGGATWDTVKTVTDSTIQSLKFLNDNTIIAATDDPMGGIMISSDTGRTWQFDPNTLTFFYPQMKAVAASKTDSFIIAGRVNWDTTGLIMWGNNGWISMENTEQVMNGIDTRDDSVAFVVGNYGLILSNKHIVVVDIEDISKHDEGILIYPNPSSGVFTTEMKEAHVVTVYDISGRLIYLTPDYRKEHGIVLPGCAPGVYFVQLTTGSGNVNYKQLVIK